MYLEAAGAAVPGVAAHAAAAADESPSVALAHPAVAAGLDVLNDGRKKSSLFIPQVMRGAARKVLPLIFSNSTFCF